MTRAQAKQLSAALKGWAEGLIMEARDMSRPDTNWYPVFPDSYESLDVREGTEWRAVRTSPLVTSGALDGFHPQKD